MEATVHNMAKITLNLLNIFALKLDKSAVKYEGDTVGDIITLFLKDHAELLDDALLSRNKKKLHKDILILVNGRNITYLDKYKTILKDDDEVYLSIALAGG